MDLSNPYSGMFPTVDSAVLTVLSQTMKPRTGREIARLAERSQSATQRVLERLVEHGLVEQEEAGRSRIYLLNREHLAADPIAGLVGLRSALFRRLERALGLWRPPPVHASVFGSAARGDGDLDSDVDILLIRPGGVDEEEVAWRSQVDTLGEQIFEWTGNHAGIAEVGEQDLDPFRYDRPAVISNIELEAVEVFGPPIRELLDRY